MQQEYREKKQTVTLIPLRVLSRPDEEIRVTDLFFLSRLLFEYGYAILLDS
jgi:hypothetical protein